MSILISSSAEIHSNPLNNSHSKAQYTFSKEEKFNELKKLINANPNKISSYLHGDSYKKLSSLSKIAGKFSNEKRPSNIFREMN